MSCNAENLGGTWVQGYTEVMVGARNTKYVHNSNNIDLEGGYSVLGCARTLVIRNYVELVKLSPITRGQIRNQFKLTYLLIVLVSLDTARWYISHLIP